LVAGTEEREQPGIETAAKRTPILGAAVSVTRSVAGQGTILVTAKSLTSKLNPVSNRRINLNADS
jgi:hypothetical protein